MDAGDTGETLTTRPIRFNGRHLFVNAEVRKGELSVEILDLDGTVIEPFSRERCIPVHVDSTRTEIQWRQQSDLSVVAGKTVRLRFHVRNGSLYSFWVSADTSGASQGYIAGGGPAEIQGNAF